MLVDDPNQQRGHYEVTKVNDDNTVNVRHDETGHEMVLHNHRFHDLFAHSHEEAMRAQHQTSDALPTTKTGGIDRHAIYAQLIGEAGIKDHDMARADAAFLKWKGYKDALGSTKKRNKQGALKGKGKGKREARPSFDGEKPKPWKGGELDAFREHAGRKEGAKFTSLIQAFDHAMRGVKTWREVHQKIIPMLREVPGFERVNIPMDALVRHATQDDIARRGGTGFQAEEYGHSLSEARDDDSDGADVSFNPDDFGKSRGFGIFLRADLVDNLDLFKARFHKYLRRIPTGNLKHPYRYVYSIQSEAHGSPVAVGEKVKIADEGKEGHYEVKHVDGDDVHLEHDESGRKLVVSRAHLHDMFSREHVRNIANRHAQLQKIHTQAHITGTAGQQAAAGRHLEKFERTFGLQRPRALPSAVNDAVEREMATEPVSTAKWSAGKGKPTPGQELLNAEKQNKQLKAAAAKVPGKRATAPSETGMKAALDDKDAADKAALEKYRADWAPWRETMDKLSAQMNENPKPTADSQREAAKLYEELAKHARAAGGHQGEERGGRAERMAAALHKDADHREETDAPKPKPATPAAAKPEPKAAPAAEKPKGGGDDSRRTHKEVGEHVWGARRDIAALRLKAKAGALTGEDLSSLSYSDAAGLVTKANLVPVKSPEEWKSRGATPGAAHLGLTVLSLIQAKPADSPEARAAYASGVRMVLGSLNALKTAADFETWRKEMVDKVRGAGRVEVPVRESSPAFTIDEEKANNKDPNVKIVSTSGYEGHGGFRTRIYRENAEERARVLDTFAQLGNRFVGELGIGRTMEHGGKKIFTHVGGRTGKTWDTSHRLARGLEAHPAEIAWVELDDLRGKKRATAKEGGTAAEPKKGRESIVQKVAGTPKRVGGRPIEQNASGERLAKTFGFKNVDHGKYMNDDDREFHLKHAEGALHDLADMIGVDDKQISMNGRLALAFGARGKGGKGAARAHYETDPSNPVINITKFAGGGSLAHEWGHFMDHFIAHLAKPTTSTRDVPFGTAAVGSHLGVSLGAAKGLAEAKAAIDPHVAAALKNVVETMVSQPKDADAEEKNKAKRMEMWKQNGEGAARFAELKKLDRKGKLTDEHRKEWSALVKRHNENLRQINQSHRDDQQAGRTLYWRHAEALDGESATPYHALVEEGFARAWESFIEDKLHAAGRRNSYLVDGTREHYETLHDVDGEPAQPYPQGAERERINVAMEKLCAALRANKHFEKAMRYVLDLRKAS